MYPSKLQAGHLTQPSSAVAVLANRIATVGPCKPWRQQPAAGKIPLLLQSKHAHGAATLQQRQQPCRQHVACAAVVEHSMAAIAASPYWDYVCAVLTAAVALVWVKLFDVLAGSGVLEQVRG